MKQRVYAVVSLTALVGAMALCFVALSGCAAQPVATTQPATTQPVATPDENAYVIASRVVADLETAADVVIATGALKPADVAAINLARQEIDKSLATWRATLNQPASTKLEAQFWALFPDLANLVAKHKAATTALTR